MSTSETKINDPHIALSELRSGDVVEVHLTKYTRQMLLGSSVRTSWKPIEEIVPAVPVPGGLGYLRYQHGSTMLVIENVAARSYMGPGLPQTPGILTAIDHTGRLVGLRYAWHTTLAEVELRMVGQR